MQLCCHGGADDDDDEAVQSSMGSIPLFHYAERMSGFVVDV